MFSYIEMQVLQLKVSSLSRQVISHGSGVSRLVSLYYCASGLMGPIVVDPSTFKNALFITAAAVPKDLMMI